MSNVSMIDGHIDEPRMTDNEIIKALEKLLLDFRKIEYRDSICQLIEDALNLINHQKEQINGLIAGQETLQKHLAEKNKEVERLKNAYKQCAWERDTFFEEISKTPKTDTSVSLIDGHIESDKASRKAFWEDTH